ncbi:HAMP domain-containing histidine kinase [Phaeobacter inhibens]|uniref:sensor histidine kinase n=2 Tax=Phaeobacter inhibens TaxID=221822 RepID=UPI0021A88198|nr:HAMP domain-containing sensor histidine kinase [Phaeobacter inhibens]UWR55368.1 HAMP domain-containing histidine kinase [Phaeobacter inhibens]UWR63770.1 HAMP domain-containing histidine kinase [Phaeobacter inhibens]UWR99368.1 HAMP domain-containing histidine kinase [Phaeobacter inhibens]UWS03258.1 HAMP domain-containing histidine kinase [Phaeobacter inhibens]
MSLTARLRSCVVICLASICVAMYAEWNDLSRIERKTENLSDRTIPLLDRIADLGDLQHGLEVTLARVRLIDDLDGLAGLGRRVDNLSQLFRENFSDREDTIAEELSSADADVFQNVVKGRQDIVAQNIRINALVSQAVDKILALEKSIVVAQIEFGNQQRDAQSRQEGSLSVTWAIDTAKTLGEISGSIASLAILTKDFSLETGTGNTGARQSLVAEINILASRLARLKNLEARHDIAGVLVDYRNTMLGPDGVVEALSALQTRQAGQEQLYGEAEAVLNNIGAWTRSSTQRAAMEFRQSAAETSRIVERIRFVDVAFNMCMLLISLALLWFMIEVRMISRIHRLTRHIQRMSRGHLEDPIDTAGSDEIAEIAKAVEKSRLTAAALQRSNEELERFAYVAAHDLRAPLRAISNLIEWTEEDFADEMPADAQKNIGLIRNRTDRLSGHLSALLDYARAGQIDGEHGAFSLTKFAEELRLYFNSNSAFEIRVEQDCGPFGAYLTPLKTILINLVSNASKHHDRSSGTIRMSSELYPNYVEITVADDGPGIPKQYQDQIFVLFQTLKSRDEIEGSGLGLALVQKLARSLGGSVSVVSNPDVARGTVFTVRIPLNTPSAKTPNDIQGLAA